MSIPLAAVFDLVFLLSDACVLAIELAVAFGPTPGDVAGVVALGVVEGVVLLGVVVVVVVVIGSPSSSSCPRPGVDMILPSPFVLCSPKVLSIRVIKLDELMRSWVSSPSAAGGEFS